MEGYPKTTKRMYKSLSENYDDREDIIKKFNEGFSCVSENLVGDECCIALQSTGEFTEAINHFVESPKMKLFYSKPKLEALNKNDLKSSGQYFHRPTKVVVIEAE